MSEELNKPPQPKPKRRWLRRLLRGVLWLLLALVLLHRPLVHYGGRWVAIWLAKKQHIALDLHIEGNLWSHFELHDVRASADGTGPAPIERVKLDRIALDYSIYQLLRGNLAGLRSAEIGTLDAVITPQPSAKKPGEVKKPSLPIAEQLRAALAKPLPIGRVQIIRADVLVKQAGSEIVVRNFHLLLAQKERGNLGWDEIRVPGLPALVAANAATTLDASGLHIEDLAILPGVRLSTLGVTTSATPEISLKLAAFGGEVALRLSPKDGSLSAPITAENLDLTAAANTFGGKAEIPLQLTSLDVQFSGDPERMETWRPKIAATLTGKAGGPLANVKAQLNVDGAGREIFLRSLTLTAPGVKLAVEGHALLPPSFAGGALPEVDATFSLDAPALGALAGIPELKAMLDAKGAATARGTARLAQGRLVADTQLEARDIAVQDVAIGTIKTTIHAEQVLPAAAPLIGLVAQVETNVEGVAVGTIRADAIALSANLRDQRATLHELRVTRGSNEIHAEGGVALTEAGKIVGSPELKFTLSAPALAEFGIAVNAATLGGQLTGDGQLALDGTEPRGTVTLAGKELQLGTAHIGELDLQAGIEKGVATLKTLRVQFPGKNTLAVEGHIATTEKPQPYAATANLDLRELAAFEPLLAVLGIKEKVGGSLALDWSGSGDLAHHRGNARLAAKDVRFGATNIAEAKLAADYTPETVQTTELLVVADKLRAAAKLAWAKQRLDVTGIDLRYAGESVLVGDISAPFDPKAEQPLPPDQPVSAKLAARNLDPTKLFASLGKKSPVSGIFNATLDATGTVTKPVLKMDIGGRTLRSPAAERLAPADLDIRLSFENDQLQLAATVRQPDFKPLTLTADVPIPLEQLIKEKRLDPAKIPLKGSIELPASQLAVLAKFAPAISKLDGTAAISVRATGTLAKPQIDGSASLDVKFLRLTNEAAPSVSNFVARLGFANDTLTFQRFKGDIGGGNFTLAGTLNLVKPGEPVFNLTLKSKEVLVVRDDSALVRADADLTLRGPLTAATASGTVFLTQSRFTKEVDILPLSLPGRSKPTPRSVSQPKVISFPNPPLRDWKFDIALKTRDGDPFLVRGNLARGAFSMDVKLAGTGLAPYLVGAATVDHFLAELPVSVLKTRRGLITFSQQAPFEPQIDIEAETVIQKYNIVARVSGPSSHTRLDLESEPPLSQQDILSLLTTGSTSGEIGSNNSALATRAAVLVVKRWYKKLFKRDFPGSTDEGGDSFRDRFQVDIGNVDPKTGRNEVSTQFRVTDNLFILGDLELGGGVAGRVKYVLRFR